MNKWIPGVVIARLGDIHYTIEYNGRRFKRHVDQIRNRVEKSKTKGREQYA